MYFHLLMLLNFCLQPLNSLYLKPFECGSGFSLILSFPGKDLLANQKLSPAFFQLKAFYIYLILVISESILKFSFNSIYFLNLIGCMQSYLN